MIAGIGVDTLEINRFVPWTQWNDAQRSKIFSGAEIAYCKQCKKLEVQRIAVRFAAREAFFKALCAAGIEPYTPFLRVCKSISVMHGGKHGAPQLLVDWKTLGVEYKFKAHLSLTHSENWATAFVILEY